MEKLILYSYYRSSASFRVRIALNLKELQYNYRAIHLLNNGGEQFKADYTALNPAAKVPCLIDHGRALGESMAIMEYLNEIYPEPPLLPQDPWLRAKTRQIAEVINSGIQPLQNVSVTEHLHKELHATPEQVKEWLKRFIESGLAAVESLLHETSGTYSVGGQVTLADACLVPQYISSQRFQVDLAKFPIFSAVAQRCLELEPFARALPARQPDAPAEVK